jgi:hypothetical protein
MGQPGPKPVDVELLKTYATQWANLLLMLRNGEDGVIRKNPQGAKRSVLAKIPCMGTEPRLRKEFLKLAQTNPGLIISFPIFPRPHLWEQLKEAGSIEEMRHAARGIQRWIVAQGLETRMSPAFYNLLRVHAADLLAAKHLWIYPRSIERQSSDKKRIEFFSKVLAGLMLGLAPATAAKRLSHWRPDRISIDRIIQIENEGVAP